MAASNRLLHLTEKLLARAVSLLMPGMRQGRREPVRTLSPGEGRKVLVTKSCCFGDALLSLYALRAYQEAHPQDRIHVLTTHRVQAVFALEPSIEKIIVMPVTGKRALLEIARPGFLRELFRFLGELRQAGYQLLIDCELHHEYGPFLQAWGRIPLSRGFKVPGTPARNYDCLVDRLQDEPEWRCFYKLFALPVPETPPALFPPSVVIQHPKPGKVGIVFGSSFNWPQKKWPLAYFRRLVEELVPEFPCLLIGAAHEAHIAKALALRLPNVEIVAGDLPLPQLIRKIHECILVVGNDTGALHLAAACGVPTLGLFGPTNDRKWGPIDGQILRSEDLACSPCYYLGKMPDCGHRTCLREIEPHAVLEKCRPLLESM